MLGYIDPQWTSLPAQSLGPWLGALLAGVSGLVGVVLGRLGGPVVRQLKRHWRKGLLALLAVATLAGLAWGGWKVLRGNWATTTSSSRGPTPRVLVLGMDGLDPDLLEAMMNSGDLPAFSRMKTDGAFARLGTSWPPQSPVAWLDVACGADAGVHGVFDFIHRRQSDYELGLSINPPADRGGYANPRLGESFWEALSRQGVPTRLLFYPCEFPPQPLRGTSLAGMGAPDLQGSMGRYLLASTDVKWARRELGGRLAPLAYRTDRMCFTLPGPRFSEGQESAGIEVEIRRSGDSQISVAVQGQSLTLDQGQWSPWLRLRFRTGVFGSMAGIFRLYLASSRPELNLYCTPIQFDPLAPAYPISWPEDYSAQLVRQVGEFATLGLPVDTKAFEDGVLDEAAFCRMAADVFSEHRRILLQELERWDGGVLVAYFGEADSVSHMTWVDLLKRRLADQGPGAIPPPIREAYKRLDGLLGEILDRFRDAPEVQLIVLSDHGFDDYSVSLHMNRLLAQLGYLALKPDAAAGGPLFADVDWSRTQAYACGFGSIYLNVRGREGRGIVEPSDVPQRARKIREDLLAWREPGSSESLFVDIGIGGELYHGAAGVSGPDLVAGCRPPVRFSWQTAVGSTPEKVLEPNTRRWRGDHLFAPSAVPGILLVRRPGGKLPSDLRGIRALIESHYGEGGERP